MTHAATLPKTSGAEPASWPGAGLVSVQKLDDAHGPEALAFLAPRSVEAIFMSGLIRDNGVESPLNRGAFYAYRDGRGRLEGVALIGHATLVEARTDEALRAFAGLAQDCPHAHVILGDERTAERFWGYYAFGGQAPLRFCRELLYAQTDPAPAAGEPEYVLRRAAPHDLAAVESVNARIAFDESGVDPLVADPEGFRRRLLLRIRRGRVWVWTEGGALAFKADVMADTPEAAYLEGVYVRPDLRGRGHAQRCLAQLSRMLLARARRVCLLVNEENVRAQKVYLRAGYELCGRYDTIFLKEGGGRR